MSYVTPPADFDTRYATGDIDGALAPLHSVNTSIGIFNDLGAQITLVSTDGTAAANSDTQLMTMKAIKTLGASGGIVTAPLVLTSNTAYQLACKQTGHLGGVTMGYTVGDVCELDCTDPIIVTNAANALSPTTGGALQVKGGISTAKTVWGANLGAANNDGNPQLQVFFDPTHSADFRCTAAGALHLNSSGGSIETDASDQVNVLNTTASSSKITGALTTPGGIGVSKKSFMSDIDCTSTTGTQLQVGYDVTHYGTVGANSSGGLILSSSGGIVSFPTGNTVKVIDPTASTLIGNGALVVSGGISAAQSSNFTTLTCTSTGTKLNMVYDATHTGSVDITNTGSMVLTASGPNCYVASGNIFRPLNTTASADKASGAIVTPGGIGVSKKSFMSDIDCTSTTGSQLQVGYDATHYFLTQVDGSGNSLFYATSGLVGIDPSARLKSNNILAASSKTNASAMFVGGIGVSAASYFDQVTIQTTAGPALAVNYDATHGLYVYPFATGEVQFATQTAGMPIQIGSNNPLAVFNTTDCTAIGTAAVIMSGGLSVAKQLRVGTGLTVSGVINPAGGFTAVWKTTRLDLEIASGNTPTMTAVKTYAWLPAFSASAINSLYGNVQMPRDYLAGSQYFIEVDWMPIDATAGNVIFNVIYEMLDVGAVMPNNGSWPNTSTSAAAPGVAFQSARTVILNQNGSGVTAGQNLYLVVSRLGNDGGDTYAAVIYLIQVRLRYQSTSLGDFV